MKQILILLIISGHLYGQDTALAQTIVWDNVEWDSAPKLDTIRLSAGKGTVIYQSNDTVYSRLDTIPWKPYFRKPKVKRAAWFKTFPVKEWFPDQSKTEYGIIQHQTPDTDFRAVLIAKAEQSWADMAWKISPGDTIESYGALDVRFKNGDHWMTFQTYETPAWYHGDHWWKWLGFGIGCAAVVLLLLLLLFGYMIELDDRKAEKQDYLLRQRGYLRYNKKEGE